ncbi:MAG: ribosomal protein S18-alanine N-acetyltransferase [Synechococcaceae cyanobacterium RM1_1_27]|nr:ribosomal protein S18-alanine N-acetyltransferase [Synechococcaceae cyanobacterium SM2_3_2]NJO85974.1 ribosomal protein S18-alanine N-acetyltransferase [Synechococcaceae cyanobacterium RM1_1_27]
MAEYLLQSLDRTYLDQLMQLDLLCYGGHWGSQSYEEELDRTNTDVLGYLWGSDLVAFGILWRVLEEAHLISLAVHPDHRRQRLGSKLVAALLAQAWRQGSEWATLEVRSSNEAAQALYQRCGFQLLGRRQHYYQDPDEDALIYWQKLAETELPGSLVEPESSYTF